MKKGWCKDMSEEVMTGYEDMSEETKTGYWKRGTRAKEGAYATIDNITKFALSDDDYEEYEEWVEYTEEELAQFAAQEEAAVKKIVQEAFLEEAPERLGLAELGVIEAQEAVAELGVLADDNSVSIEDLMEAIAELGALVASSME